MKEAGALSLRKIGMLSTVEQQILAKDQEVANARLPKDFPRMLVPALPDNNHCRKCENVNGEWWHKCGSCGLKLPTKYAYTKAGKDGNRHQSSCRRCAGNLAASRRRVTIERAASPVKLASNDLVAISEVLAKLTPRKLQAELLAKRNQRDLLSREIRILENIQRMIEEGGDR